MAIWLLELEPQSHRKNQSFPSANIRRLAAATTHCTDWNSAESRRDHANINFVATKFLLLASNDTAIHSCYCIVLVMTIELVWRSALPTTCGAPARRLTA